MKRPKFGSVVFSDYRELSPRQQEAARRMVAAPGREMASHGRSELFEFGLVEGAVALARPIGDAVVSDEDVEGDTICEECKVPFADDDVAECGICLALVCDKCEGEHEWRCDRWR